MPKEWHFIEATGQGKVKDQGSRKLVRRTVMREFRRNERLERVNQFQNEIAAEQHARRRRGSHDQQGKSNSGLGGQVVHHEDAELFSQWRATLVDIGPAAVFDPFVCTTLYSNKNHIRLFTRFVYRVAVQIQPIGSDVTKNPFNVVFARNALADSLILSALLYHASVHTDSSSAETLHLETETARQLSERLSDPAQAASDAVIGTVALLAATGNITGNVGRELPHWKALAQLVKIRGGLQALGWDGGLSMVLSVSDIISATITFLKPNLPFPHFPSGLPREPLHMMAFSPAVPRSRDLPAQIRYISLLIKQISELATQVLKPDNVLKASTASIIAHTQVISAIEHRLLSIEDPDDVPEHELPLLHVIRAGKAAALISTTYYFRIMRITSATTRSLRGKIVAALETLESGNIDALNIETLKLLLWSSWIGYLVAEDQDWFVIHVHRFMIRMDLRSWEDVQTCLKGFTLASKRHDSLGILASERGKSPSTFPAQL